MRRFLLLALMAVALFTGAQFGAQLGPRALVVRLSDQALVAYLLRDGRLLLSTSDDWRDGGLRLVTIETEEAGRYFNSLDALRSAGVDVDNAVTFAFDRDNPSVAVPLPSDGVSTDRDLAAFADALFRTIRMGGGASLPVGDVDYRALLVPVDVSDAATSISAALLPVDRYASAGGAVLSRETLQVLRRTLADGDRTPVVRIDGTTYRLSVWVDPSPEQLTPLPLDPDFAPSATP